ncbi:ABC transporter ATP-binding protein/permease [Streptomyces sp. NBC_01498]|nr:ABC transporter ATP-binding protein [Streptomyces sp. NBC_01498]WTL29031.1 ABC transporter ATP-binding protein/permease [Streptomyces sp. NBC_01498]
MLGAARHSAGRTTAVFLCSAASAGASLALPAVLGRTLDLLLRRSPGADPWLLACAALVVAEVLLDALVAMLGGTTGARSTAWLRTRGVNRLLAAWPGHAARFPAGDVTVRLTANATEAGTAPVAAATLGASLLAPVGAVAALFLIDPWTALTFLAGLPLLMLVLRAFARGSSDSVASYQRVQADIATRLVETLAGARTIAAAGTEERDRDRVLAPLPELAAQGTRMWRIHGAAVARSGVLLPLLTTAVLAVGGLRLASGDMSVGELLAAARYAALAAGVGTAAGLLGSLIRSRAAARRTAGLTALPSMTYGTRSLPPQGGGRLELRGVAVRHEGRAVLDGVDLTVDGGMSVAVVGRSGAGKSTLAAVAGRLTEPDEGTVLLDGVPLGDIPHDELRDEVGHAFERPVLFGATLAEALAGRAPLPEERTGRTRPLGAGAGRDTGERVRAAARAASADAFVRLLPHGYATAPHAAPLSGGELQRLGLARAFARAGRLLVLDDATSSLDTVTEHQVERALAGEVRHGTRLIVAHRLSSAARCDRVVWLEEGRVRATGTHEELWRTPEYRALFAPPEPGPSETASWETAPPEPGAHQPARPEPGPSQPGPPGPGPSETAPAVTPYARSVPPAPAVVTEAADR